MNELTDFIVELRRQARCDYDLQSPYSAGIAAGLAMAATQLRLAFEGPRTEWRVTNWGGKPAHPVWIPRPTYADLFRDVRECSVEVLAVDIVGPTLVHVRVLDADGGRMFPAVVILEEVTR